MNLHIGPLPADPVTRGRIERSNQMGFPTITAAAYAALVQAGVEPQNLTPGQVAQALGELPKPFAPTHAACDLV